jgi:hypothetical protein
MAGDMVNIPDRASEWFDDNRGNAFFPCLQGRAEFVLKPSLDAPTGTRYVGGEIIQHAPLFSALGNHEVMGRYGRLSSLNEEFEDAIPRDVALQLYGENNLKANSYNTDTYEEILTLPQSFDGGERYYAVTFGDVRLVSLYATNLWRLPSVEPNDRISVKPGVTVRLSLKRSLREVPNTTGSSKNSAARSFSRFATKS